MESGWAGMGWFGLGGGWGGLGWEVAKATG